MNETPAPPEGPGTQPLYSGFRPLGNSNLPDGPMLLQGLNGVVTNIVTAQRETQKITKEILAASERTARMMGTVIEQAQTLEIMQGTRAMNGGSRGGGAVAVGGGFTPVSGLSYAHEQSTPVAGGGAEPAPGVSADAQRGRAAADRRGMGEGRAGGPGGAQPAPKTPPGFQFPQTWDEGRKFDLGSLRQNVAREVNQEVSEWSNGGKQYFRAAEDQMVDGRMIRKGQYLAARDASGATIPGTGSRPAPRGGPKTVGARLVQNEAGEWLPEVVGNPGWRYRASAAARNVAGSMAEGEGIGTALSKAGPTIGKALGVAGAVYVGANTALNFAESQREQNMAFQSVLGGSNAEGFSERMRQNVFRLGLRGTMGGADAEMIYKSAMENYGTNRAARNDYQSAAVRMYGSGVGADESIGLLNQAAKRGNDNVRLLAESVVALGQVARSAGESAAEARQKFSEAMDTYSGMSSGTQQIQAASLEASVRTSMGDRLGAVTYSGQNSALGQRRMAQMLGVSYTDLNAAMNSGSQRLTIDGREVSGTQALAMGKDRMMGQAISSLDPRQQITNAIREKARAMGYSDRDFMDIGKIEEIAAAVQSEMPGDLTDPMRVGGILRTVGGADVSDNDAMTMLTQSILTPGLNERTLGNMNAVPDPDGKGFKGLTKDDWKDIQSPGKLNDRTRAAYDFIEEELGYNLADNDAQQRVKKGELDSGKGRKFTERSPEDQFRNRLVEDIATGRGLDANLYALYKNKDELADSRFVVKVAGGKEQSVEFGELANDYADQVAANPELIQIQGGRYGGQDLYQALGIQSDGSKATSDNRKPPSGVSVEEGEKRTKEDEKSTGTVEIFLTDEAKRLIDVRTTGSARYARSYNESPPSGASTPPEQSGD